MTEDLRTVAEQLTRELGLEMPPVQITYLDHPPKGIPEHPGGVPSVCTFFAFGTRSAFYAGLPQHEDCEIGAFVLGIPPEGAVGGRLMATIGEMQKEGYLNPGRGGEGPAQRDRAEVRRLRTARVDVARPDHRPHVHEPARRHAGGRGGRFRSGYLDRADERTTDVRDRADPEPGRPGRRIARMRRVDGSTRTSARTRWSSA